nr:MAG TPA: hypothetical protein [Caudoviricetes sp.]
MWYDNNTIKAIWFPCKNQPLFLFFSLQTAFTQS